MSETYFRELLSSIRRSPMVNPGTDSQDKEGKRSLSETGAAVSEDSETVAEIRIPLRLSRDGISGEEIPSYSGSYLSMACYREFNGDWTYWMNGPYFSGRMSGYAFYTVGTVYMDALCQGRNVPKSLADVRIEFTGDLEY